MSGYNRINKYVSGKFAIRQAFGAIGYASEEGNLKPDLANWIADGNDKISPLKTYKYIPCQEYEVCNNRIEIPLAMQIILCATWNGHPMTYLNTPGCNRLWENSVNYPKNTYRGCNRVPQGFWVDECYMHFKPFLPDGTLICIDAMARPLDDDGFPMVQECCILAVSEYLAARIALRFRDNRYGEFKQNWKDECKRARAQLNQLSNNDIQKLGFIWFTQPVPATYAAGWAGFGYSGNAIRG